MNTLNIDEAVTSNIEEIFLGIDGVKFERNNWNICSSGANAHIKLSSSEGPQISDFVTHERGFEYSTAGIHIGQDDRLTFLSPYPCNINTA